MKYILAPLPKRPLLDRLAASSRQYTIELEHELPGTLPLPLSPWAWPQFRAKLDSRERLAAALEVLRAVAREDEDHARNINGRGYSKADSSAGHRLAQMSVSDVSRDGQAERDVLRLARRYSRQASSIANTKD
ncbi:hypothetical protein [Pararhizobium sp.]|uniref:hypothetical protein n=1 Tax=Pararhizobium sp. TaxID=1977563 RepID=UPI003D0EEAA7